MNRRFDVMETLGLNRRIRNGSASRKSGPKSNGKAPQPKREKTRLARLEQLEERALLPCPRRSLRPTTLSPPRSPS